MEAISGLDRWCRLGVWCLEEILPKWLTNSCEISKPASPQTSFFFFSFFFGTPNKIYAHKKISGAKTYLPDVGHLAICVRLLHPLWDCWKESHLQSLALPTLPRSMVFVQMVAWLATGRAGKVWMILVEIWTWYHYISFAYGHELSFRSFSILVSDLLLCVLSMFNTFVIIQIFNLAGFQVSFVPVAWFI